MAAQQHIPVLLKEVIEQLALKPGMNAVDGTVGAGGHSASILDRTAPGGRLLGLDLDEAALDSARSTLGRYGSRAMLVRENYKNVRRVLQPDFGPVQAALLDLGFSSIEIDDATRGFSFRADGPLDMRYDGSAELDAATIVNSWSLDDLAGILWEFGEERLARRIAAAIVKARREQTIIGTLQLVAIIAGAVPAAYRRGRIHFATRTFQALRIAVNDELGNLSAALPEYVEMLQSGGRLAVITFHSLEDRIVKHFFKTAADQGKVEILTKKPLGPSEEEIASNPRARSAKLRVAQKI